MGHTDEHWGLTLSCRLTTSDLASMLKKTTTKHKQTIKNYCLILKLFLEIIWSFVIFRENCCDYYTYYVGCQKGDFSKHNPELIRSVL